MSDRFKSSRVHRQKPPEPQIRGYARPEHDTKAHQQIGPDELKQLLDETLPGMPQGKRLSLRTLTQGRTLVGDMSFLPFEKLNFTGVDLGQCFILPQFHADVKGQYIGRLNSAAEPSEGRGM